MFKASTTLLGFLCIGAVSSLHILEHGLPIVIENGSQPFVVLDCEFQLDEQEEEDVVIKWYYNDRPYPVYQWIPPNPPQDFDVLKGKIDLTYEVEDKNGFVHRAIKLIDPTIEQSGMYECVVSTFKDEVRLRRRLVIYSAPTAFSMYHDTPEHGSVRVACRVESVFPKPDINLYQGNGDGKRLSVDDVNVVEYRRYGAYDITVSQIFQDESLHPQTLFECALVIPHTQYTLRKKIMYYPAGASQLGILWMDVFLSAVIGLFGLLGDLLQ